MNHKTNSLLKDFTRIHKIQSNDESKNFEHFCNYIIITNQYSEPFDFNDISTGEGGDTGIDGIGIIVNGSLVNNETKIDDFLSKNKNLNAEFVFIQSKKSPRFNSRDILKFYHGVLNFFKEPPLLPNNKTVKKLINQKNKIFQANEENNNKLNIKVFYATTGIKPNSDDINSVINTHKENLTALNIFKNIDVALFGAEELKKLYRKAKTKNSAKFTFKDNIKLPPIIDIKKAYYGIIPFKEFKKILNPKGDHLENLGDHLPNLFDDNVRDYQGDKNKVNSGILETLESSTPDLFSVLNNGVTIVANDATSFRKSITIKDYQIVNGCQTSNVLFRNQDIGSIDEIQIPLRLIVTENEDVKFRIIISTNNQTATKKVQLAAMSDFQKGLETYYNTRGDKEKIYYERRSKQYAFDTNVDNKQIITIKNQAKSYSSMFRRDPHIVTTYFGKLADDMKKSESGLCDDKHQYVPYYMAGLAYYKLDSLFRSKDIDKKFKKVRFYVLMLVRRIATNQKNPSMEDPDETDSFCEPIIKKLLDDKTCLKIFKKAAEIIERSKAPIDDKQALKSQAMTTLIYDEFKATDRI